MSGRRLLGANRDEASTSGSRCLRGSTVRRGGGRHERAGRGQPGGSRGEPRAGSGAAVGRGGQGGLIPGNLLVSESYYSNDPGIVAGQTPLPPGGTGGQCATPAGARGRPD